MSKAPPTANPSFPRPQGAHGERCPQLDAADLCPRPATCPDMFPLLVVGGSLSLLHGGDFRGSSPSDLGTIWHISSVCSVTVFTVITTIVALPLLSAIVFPVKRRNRHSLVGPQQAGGRPAPVRRSNTMPPNLGNAGLLGRMLDEKSPPSPSGTFLSHGRSG